MIFCYWIKSGDKIKIIRSGRQTRFARVSNKIKAAILISAPFDDEGSEEKLASFALAGSMEKFSQQVGQIYLLQSKDDPVVDFAQVEKYQKALPGAKTIIFADRGHFNTETFPEIVELIKGIASSL